MRFRRSYRVVLVLPLLNSVISHAANLTSLAAKYPPSTLPAPEGLHLQYVVLGVGTQNYTCTGGEASEPGTTGALGM
jgi:hypothetical protein